MTNPRQVLPNRTYGVARRCSERRYFLRPGTWENAVFRFLLAHYATKHRILLHGFTFMANHYHLVLTDQEGRLPFFMRDLDNMLSRVLNQRLKRRGRLWESTPYAAWILETEEDVLSQLAYVAANPVEANVVRQPDQWPGLVSLPGDFTTPQRCLPPPGGLFESGRTSLPEAAILELHVPPASAAPSKARFAARFQAVLDAVVHEICSSRTAPFAGRRSVFKLDPFSAPLTNATPTFSSAPSLSNASRERKQELKAFRSAYAETRAVWNTNKAVVFPQGTFYVVQFAGAKSVPPDD